MEENIMEIMVSIICNVFNHEMYIEDALKGFINQKTDFPFEVLIHDDASTDGSAKIIKKYEELYPEIIKPIYQTENQYSKGKGIIIPFQLPRAKGKYIAFCEGDDFWTDNYKLQKQFDILESHKEIDMCSHSAIIINAASGEKISDYITKASETILTVEEVILGGGGYVSTASLFFRKDILINEMNFRKILRLDYTLQIRGALKGGIYYLPDNMSVYRANVKNSWTDRMKKNYKGKCIHFKKVIKCLNSLNSETNKKYNKVIVKVLAKTYVKYFAFKFLSLIFRK